MIPFIQLLNMSKDECKYFIYTASTEVKEKNITIENSTNTNEFKLHKQITINSVTHIYIYELIVKRDNQNGLIKLLDHNDNHHYFINVPKIDKNLTIRFKRDSEFNLNEFQDNDITIIYNKFIWGIVSNFSIYKVSHNLSPTLSLILSCLFEMFKLNNKEKISKLVPCIIIGLDLEYLYSNQSTEIKEIMSNEKTILMEEFNINLLNNKSKCSIIYNTNILFNFSSTDLVKEIIESRYKNIIIISEWDIIQVSYDTVPFLTKEIYNKYFSNQLEETELQELQALILDYSTRKNINWISTNSPFNYRLYLDDKSSDQKFIQYSLTNKKISDNDKLIVKLILSYISTAKAHKLINFSKSQEPNFLFEESSFLIQLE